MDELHKPWRPLNPLQVADLFCGAPFPSWIAGGFAIELAVGHSIRAHGDIDVLVLRRDHVAVRTRLADWDCWAADPPGTLRKWPIGEELDATVHDIWCRKNRREAWCMQLMIDESNGDHWMSRRDESIRAPLAEISATTAAGIRYLAPHIQLFYKAKNLREKDQLDFDAVIRSGVNLNAEWLRLAIMHAHGPEHPWVRQL